jgi:hypothetical protein
MRIQQSVKLLGVVFGLTLACRPDVASAQTATMLMPPGAIQPGGDATDTTLDWGVFWNGYQGAAGVGTEVFDPAVSSSSTIPGSIHVTLFMPGNTASNAPAGAANLCVGDFISAGVGYNTWLGANESSNVDFSLYSALSFDILVNINTSSNGPIPINLYSWNYDNVQIGSVPIPATQGWQHISIPIPSTFSFNDGKAPPPNGTAWGFYNWYPNNPPACEDFWIDNVQLVGEGTFPPPTLTPLAKAVQGLNAFASTEANSFWDRQGVMLLATNGLSWVSRATAAKPVSYSFTINSFPTNIPDYTAEAYLFLAPNPAAEENAPDWAETNCAIVDVMSTANGGGQMTFLYKVNEPAANAMYWGNSPYTNAPGSWNGVKPDYFESGELTNVQSAALFGTWTVQFTSDTNGTLIAPDGTTSSFIFPPYNAAKFAESTGFNVYLGMVANTAGAIDQAVVFSSFAISNVPSACSDNFLADTSLNTNLWSAAYAIRPAGVLLVPSSAPYWVGWTLPATGFSLAESASLGTNAVWRNVSTYSPIPMFSGAQQLISTNDMTSREAEFFALLKRPFSQLLVVLPGQTLAPNTPTGTTGTPNTVSLSGNGGEEDVTVYAVDSDFNLVRGSTDSISLTSTDPGTAGNLPPPQAMVNGQATFNLANYPETFYFFTAGTWTITATDTTTTNIQANTSSLVVVGP